MGLVGLVQIDLLTLLSAHPTVVRPSTRSNNRGVIGALCSALCNSHLSIDTSAGLILRTRNRGRSNEAGRDLSRFNPVKRSRRQKKQPFSQQNKYPSVRDDQLDWHIFRPWSRAGIRATTAAGCLLSADGNPARNGNFSTGDRDRKSTDPRTETANHQTRNKKPPPAAGLSYQSQCNDKTVDWMVADAVGCEPVSVPEFPANREFYREFRNYLAIWTI